MQNLQQLENLYFTWKGNLPDRIEALRNTSASSRLYFRIYDNKQTVIGVFNADIKENRAFFHFSQIFGQTSINVPKIYGVSSSETYYLIQDLGDTNLLDILKQEGESDRVKQLYKLSIDQLFRMQFAATDQIDFETFAYPRAAFDKQAVLWDLYYFKYYFLKVSGLSFDEQLLEYDFQFLAESIAQQEWTAFMFRDFQARNIQIVDQKPWLIDYQGGRKGPVLYDLVSLLYQASAQLSPPYREELKLYYKNLLSQKVTVQDDMFEKAMNSLALIRIVQTLGAYGYRGLIEKKKYFIDSIPMALSNLENLLKNQAFKSEIPYFIEILSDLSQLKIKFVNK